MDQHYTLIEVAEKLKVNARTIRRAIASKKLSAVKVGRQLRITDDMVADYLDRRTLKARKTA